MSSLVNDGQALAATNVAYLSEQFPSTIFSRTSQTEQLMSMQTITPDF